MKQISSNPVQVLCKSRLQYHHWGKTMPLPKCHLFRNLEKWLCFWPDDHAFFNSSGGFWKVLVSPWLIDLSQATEDSAILHFEWRHVNTSKTPVTVWGFLPRAALECTWVLNYSCIWVAASVRLHLCFLLYTPFKNEPDFLCFWSKSYYSSLELNWS